MGKKSKKKCCDDEEHPVYSYGAEGGSGISKKKRVVKLSRKQLKRKEKKRSKGEEAVDRKNRKELLKQVRLERRVNARSLW